jgi:hypothetical protein
LISYASAHLEADGGGASADAVIAFAPAALAQQRVGN